MFDALRLRILHDTPFVRNLRKAAISEKYCSFPVIDDKKCAPDCSDCISGCPTHAISAKPLRLDLGKCIGCGDCRNKCAGNAIEFKNSVKTSSSTREGLIVDGRTDYESYSKDAVATSKLIRKNFGRSLKMRQVSAGGCNGCELELSACSNVNFDMGRFGIEFVASPRHADGIVVTGPVSSNMAKALDFAYRSIPDPKIVIACGTCAISGGLFVSSPEISRQFFEQYKVDLYIPGCPPHPLTIINGILDLIGRK